MSLDTHQHQRISRLIRTGICPGLWCSVCGYAIRSPDTAVKCLDNTCQNVCHTTCLRGEEVFSCEHTSTLREQAGITGPVEYLPADPVVGQHHTTPDADSDTAANTAEEIEDAISEPPQEDYIKVIQTQQATITKLIQQLSVFVDGNLTLGQLPAAITSAKEVIADCTTSTATIAVTARPENINKDFLKQAEKDHTLVDWWEKTAFGKKISHTNQPPSRERESERDPSSQSGTG